MELHCETGEEALVVRVGLGRLDAPVAMDFREAMERAARAGPRRVVLDLAGVEFLDSSGLGALVAVAKALGTDRRLELAGLSPGVARVLRLTRMEDVFPRHADVPAALASPSDAA